MKRRPYNRGPATDEWINKLVEVRAIHNRRMVAVPDDHPDAESLRDQIYNEGERAVETARLAYERDHKNRERAEADKAATRAAIEGALQRLTDEDVFPDLRNYTALKDRVVEVSGYSKRAVNEYLRDYLHRIPPTLHPKR